MAQDSALPLPICFPAYRFLETRLTSCFKQEICNTVLEASIIVESKDALNASCTLSGGLRSPLGDPVDKDRQMRAFCSWSESFPFPARRLSGDLGFPGSPESIAVKRFPVLSHPA